MSGFLSVVGVLICCGIIGKSLEEYFNAREQNKRNQADRIRELENRIDDLENR